MFTGLIQAVGHIQRITPMGDSRLHIGVGDLPMQDVQLGDSIAVNGVCLTVVAFAADHFVADVSAETLRVTTAQRWQVGTRVNLEKALLPTTRLGGHLVSGHVDGIAQVVSRQRSARAEEFWLRAPKELMRYIAQKGSVCVDGISLTVNDLNDDQFRLTIVPHTLDKTTIAQWQVGSEVNLEVDVLARYVERLFLQTGTTDKVNVDLLQRTGFITR